MSRYYDVTRYEIQCENGEIDEDAWRYEPVDYEDYYMIESYKYANSFPKEWARNHMEGTGPEQCGNCYCYGSKDGVFLGYCLNCAKYDYNEERGPGLDLEVESEEAEGDCEGDGSAEDEGDKAEGDKAEGEEGDGSVEKEDKPAPSVDRLAQIRAQLFECIGDIDRSFMVAEGKAPVNGPCICEFWSRMPCRCAK
jgi:hypothetical protein